MMIDINSDPNFKAPWIIGHRGYRAKFPENTLIAFEAAIAAGANMIELDVMFSRDRKVVVIHDAVLDRTTNGRGKVANFTLAKLQQLDAGSWFDSRFADQHLSELSEVLDLVHGRTYINIEIKSNVYESHQPPDAIEIQVVDLLKQKNLLATSLVSSFEINLLEQIAAMDEAPAIALISKKPVDRKTFQKCARLNMFSWHPNYRIVTRNQVSQMQAAGIKVFPYTVNRPKDYAKMIDMKVDGIITDDPESARRWPGAE